MAPLWRAPGNLLKVVLGPGPQRKDNLEDSRLLFNLLSLGLEGREKKEKSSSWM
jgi:hypothetical protein